MKRTNYLLLLALIPINFLWDVIFYNQPPIKALSYSLVFTLALGGYFMFEYRNKKQRNKK